MLMNELADDVRRLDGDNGQPTHADRRPAHVDTVMIPAADMSGD